MPVHRRASSFVLTLFVLIAMAVTAPTASAVSLDKVTGGQSGLFVPFRNIQKFGRANIFVSPIAPAFLTFTMQEGPALRFPISGGAVESATMLGTVNHDGGMLMQKFNSDGTEAKRLEVTTLRILNGNMLVGDAFGLVPAPTADLVNASHSKDPATGVIHFEADAKVGVATALVLNTYFETTVFEAGLILGHVKSDIKTKRILGL